MSRPNNQLADVSQINQSQYGIFKKMHDVVIYAVSICQNVDFELRDNFGRDDPQNDLRKPYWLVLAIALKHSVLTKNVLSRN